MVEVATLEVATLALAELLVGSAAGGLRRVAEGVLDAADDFWEHRPWLLLLRRRILPAPEPSGIAMTGSVM